MRYRDKKCKDDSWHDNKKDFCCDKKDDCKRKKEEDTVTEFDFSQSTPTTGTLINGTGPTGLNPANTIILDQVKINVNDEDNEVLIQGTVEWDPNDVSVLLALILAILAVIATGSLVLPLSVQATFRVWKSEDDKHNGLVLPIFETTDTSSIAGIALPLALVFGPTTTSFHFVDDKPSCGKNRYYLTMEVSTLASGSVTGLTGTPLPVFDILETLFPGGVIPFTTDTHVLTAMEIASVDRD
ncbi:hypothetical protein ACT6P6_26000 [Priestia endophytica]